MSSLPAFTFEAEPFGRNRLAEMYESDELFNEGLLSFEYPLFIATDDELEYFLGGLVKKAVHAAGDIGKAASRAAKTAGSVVNTVSKVVPTSVLTSALSHTPIGMAVKAGIGAVSAAASGKNVFQGALRSIASDPAMRFLVDTGMAAARGQNVLQAAKKAAQAGIGDLRESLRFAAMVAPFVPGIGTGIGAALGAANALASGQPITEALLSAARGALPGGAIAQTAFDTAVNLAKGKNFAEAALAAARNRLPGGPAAQAAFDAGLALAKGKSIQEAAFTAAGRVLPKSPYSADVLSFARKVANGENLQKAALSTAGNVVMKRIEKQAGPVLSKVPGVQREVPGLNITTASAQHGRWMRRNGKVIVLLPESNSLPARLNHHASEEVDQELEFTLQDIRERIGRLGKYGPAAVTALRLWAAAQKQLEPSSPRDEPVIVTPPPPTPPVHLKDLQKGIDIIVKGRDAEEKKKKLQKKR